MVQLQQVNLSRAKWRKAGRSGGPDGNCVEVALNVPGVVAVRDSKNPDGPRLLFTPDEWKDLCERIRKGLV